MKPIKKCYSYIRFSNVRQIEGDSLRRQIQLSEKYAEQNNLILDTKLNMHDLGLSAFKGDHVKKGALGEFINLAQKGHIERGSILLVESLDRLSRQKITVAFTQFLSLLECGISIATLQDKQLYTPESIDKNANQLMISLTIMFRAYEESKTKSTRLSASWANKREMANNKKLTAMCPKWMHLSSDRKSFQLIPERVKIIESIYTNYANGMGIGLISKTLNRDNIPTWGRGKLWWQSYIHKILRARTVIGEYQPHTRNKDRKIVKAGDPIKDYYPSAISEELFYNVQKLLSKNKTNYGKIGGCANLFVHLAKCEYCGSSMMYANKGKQGGKKYTYLVCDDARRGGKCTYRSITYPEFEKAFLNICNKLSIQDIVNESKSDVQISISDITDKLNSLSFQLTESTKKIDSWMDFMHETNETVQITLRNKIEKEHLIIEDLKNNIKLKKEQLFHIKNNDIQHDLDTIKHNIELLSGVKGDERALLRKRIQHELQLIIKRIDIAPFGHLHDIPSFINKAKTTNASEDDIQELVEHLTEQNEKASRNNKMFTVHFKDGGIIKMCYDNESKEYIKNVEIDEHKKLTVFGDEPFVSDKDTVKYMLKNC